MNGKADTKLKLDSPAQITKSTKTKRYNSHIGVQKSRK